jgi:hypothetical protein
VSLTGNTGNVIQDMSMYDDIIVFARVKGDNSRDIVIYKYLNSSWNSYPNLFDSTSQTYFQNATMNVDLHKNQLVVVSPDVSGGYGGFKVYDVSTNNTIGVNTTITNNIYGTKTRTYTEFIIPKLKEYNK